MKDKWIVALSVLIVIVLASLGILMLTGGEPQRFEYDFSESDHGWDAGWADLPQDYDPESYKLEFDRRSLPENLGNSKALFISSQNLPDDIFMYLKKQLDGLEERKSYEVVFEVELASKYPTGSVGIGGSPADSVYLKGGASTDEPQRYVDEDGWLRLNVDKGGQSQGGEQAAVLGTVAKPDDGTDRYVIVKRDNGDKPVTAKSDEEGRLWVFVGTDSGFEGLTELFYTNFTIVVKPQRIS